MVCEKDYAYVYLSHFGAEDAKATMRAFWDDMGRLGKDRNPYRAAFLQWVGVAETGAEARRLYSGPAEYFYRNCLHVDARFVNPPGYLTDTTQRAEIARQARETHAAPPGRTKFNLVARDMDTIIERGYVIIGSPDEVADQLADVARALNVGHLLLAMQFGNMSKQLALYNTGLFAQKVMPQLAGLFGEWEDRWWPRPMSGAESGPRAGDHSSKGSALATTAGLVRQMRGSSST